MRLYHLPAVHLDVRSPPPSLWLLPLTLQILGQDSDYGAALPSLAQA